MHLLMSIDDTPIHILMMSGGGMWVGAMAIFDAIRDCDTLVSIEVLGCCMSAAVIIAQACDSRRIHPNAEVLVHNGTHGFEGDTQSFEKWGIYARRARKRMYEILAETSGKTENWWKKKCAAGDFIMTASEAVDHGLFDQVVRKER